MEHTKDERSKTRNMLKALNATCFIIRHKSQQKGNITFSLAKGARYLGGIICILQPLLSIFKYINYMLSSIEYYSSRSV